MYDLPTSITIEDKQYLIRKDGDYRMVLDCFSALQDVELPEKERVITSLSIFYDSVLFSDSLYNVFEIFDTEEKLDLAVKGMFNFFNCNKQNVGNKTPYKLLDWEDDEQMIVSAVNKVANTEIRAVPYMHWFTFMGYYSAVGKSVLSTVVEIRGKIKRGKKLEKHEQEFRRDNPQYFIWNSSTVEDKEAENYVNEIWNSQ